MARSMRARSRSCRPFRTPPQNPSNKSPSCNGIQPIRSSLSPPKRLIPAAALK
jgi:hypothetical protein